MPVELYCAAMNITVPLIHGAVIGRTNGNYTALLGQCIYISGTHASLGLVAASCGNLIRIANFYDFVVR